MMQNTFKDRLLQALMIKSAKQHGSRGLEALAGKSMPRRVTGCPHLQVLHHSMPHPRYGDSVPYFVSGISREAHTEECVNPAVFGGSGVSAPWFSGTKAHHRTLFRTTGPSAFQTFKRVVEPGKRQQCEQIVLNGHREVGGPARRCRNQSVVGAKRCKAHGGTPGTPKARDGRLVSLLVEEMPVLQCDR